MSAFWRAIPPLVESSEDCYEKDGFIVASILDNGFHVWHLYCRMPDGSLEIVNGVWATQDDDFHVGLTWADRILSELESK